LFVLIGDASSARAGLPGEGFPALDIERPALGAVPKSGGQNRRRRESKKVLSVTAPGNEIRPGRHHRETSVMEKPQTVECCALALKRRESNAFQPRTGTNPGED
jgi:hypothetical protein